MNRNGVPLASFPIADFQTVRLPSGVVNAMQSSWDFEITAYLTNVQYGSKELYLQGIIYGDRDKRFEDGSTIQTSIIIDTQQSQDYLVVRTLSSLYIVCEWAGDSARENSRIKH